MTFMRKILDALTIESPKAMTDSADVDYPSENSSPTKEPIKGSIINNTGKSISYPKVTDAFLWECNSCLLYTSPSPRDYKRQKYYKTILLPIPYWVNSI